MEIVLLAITVIALLVALVTGSTAWRLAREHRARSAARIAALAAAANDDEPRERPLAVARRVALAADPAVSPQERLAPWHLDPADSAPLLIERPTRGSSAPAAAPLGDAFLGSSVAPPPSGAQRGLAIAAGILFVVVVTGAYFTAYGGGSPGMGASAQSGNTSAPLELVALSHERQNARLAISGTVRNPTGGGAVQQLSAVALLFDQQGALLSTSRADVDYKRLAPGDESPFVIQLDAPSNVARYRVSFRNPAGVVPHVDRRGQEPLARETP